MPVEQSRAKYTEELDMQPEALKYEPNATECQKMPSLEILQPPFSATVQCHCKLRLQNS